MPLWGKRDQFSVTGTVILTNGSATVTANTATLLNTELDRGDAIYLSTANTSPGVASRYRVTAQANGTSITVDPVYAGTTNATATISGQDVPKFLESRTAAAPGVRVIDVVGVDVTEARVASNRQKGIKTPGWVRVQVGSGGRAGRYNVETLVPMRSMTQAVAGDANDDDPVADS